MRVMFLQPPSPPGLDVMRDYAGGFGTAEKSERQRFGHDGSPMPYMPFLYAMARAEGDGHEVGFIDAQALDLDFEPTLVRVDAFAPEVFVVVLSLPSLSEDLEIVAAVRGRWPGVTVVASGTVAKGLTEDICAHPAVDYAIIGWEEDSVPALLRELSQANRSPCVPGVAWVESGKLQTIPADDAPPRREALMPPVHLLPMDRYRSWEFPLEKSFLTKQYGPQRRYFPLYLSLGCAFGCDYCPYPVGFGNKPRIREPEKVVVEIEHLFRAHQVDAFIFRDQNFTLPKKRVAELCSQIISRRLPVMWSCETRVDLVDGPLLTLMKRAGCLRIFFGIETGDKAMFESQGKPGAALAAAGHAFSLCRRVGITPSAHVIVGLPGETSKTVQATERLLREIGANQGNCGIVTPYPGTAFFERMVESGFVSGGDWRRFTGNDPVMSLPGFSPAQAAQAQERLRSYFRAQAERHWRRRTKRIVTAPINLVLNRRSRVKRAARPGTT